MRWMTCSLIMLTLCITIEPAEAGSGSGTRRTLRGSDAAQLRNLLPQRSRSRSTKSTRRRSLSAHGRKQAKTPTPKAQRPTGKKPIDPHIQAIIQQRIADALQTEILQNGGRLPDENRQQEIAREQFKRARTEGLIAGDADLGSASGIPDANNGGLPGGSLFNGGSSPTRKSIGTRRSQIYRPSRGSMYLPSRSRINTPRKSNLRRTGRPSSRTRSTTPGGNSALPLPDLTGGNSGTPSPEQLQRQLQQLLK